MSAGILTPSASSSSLKILSVEALEVLRVRGDNPILIQGKRAVSNTSYASASSFDSQQTVLIPDELESLETLQFLEFDDQTSDLIWQAHQERVAQFPQWADLLDSAKRHIEGCVENPMYRNDDWVGGIQRLGIRSTFRDRIMDPAYEHMRLSGSLKEWAIMMIEARYEFLVNLDDTIKAPEVNTLGRKSSKISLEKTIINTPGGVIPPRGSSSQGPKKGTFAPPSKPTIATEVHEPPSKLPEHITLWKGASLTRLNSLIQPQGALNFVNLASNPPGDFTSLRGLYFTKQESVAYEYAKWAARVIDGETVSVGLLRVCIPQQLLQSMKELFGDEWRQWVWLNLRSQLVTAHLEYVEKFQWLMGPRCHSSPKQVLKMKEASELEIWRLRGGETATQFCTYNQAMFKMLNEACVGKVLITNVAGKLAE